MRSEFVKIVVHGFKSSKKEGDIIERLLAFGFEVKDCRAIYTGMGGMIETQIMCWDELYSKSIDEISKEICVGSEIVLKYRQFSMIHDWASPTGEGETA